MRPLHQSGSHELPSLQMENELLSHETRHLRARLAQAEREIKKLKDKGKAAKRAPARDSGSPARAERQRPGAAKRKGAPKKADRAARELKRNREAHDDLRWLLGRLLHSPAGPFLRRKAGFRQLCERYKVR